MSNHTLYDDYLMRMMLPFEQAIVALLFAKKERDAKRGMEIIGQTSQKMLGMDANLLSRLSDNYLFQLFEKDSEQGAIRCLVLAALLKEEADIYQMMGDEDAAIERWTKALRVYLAVLPDRTLPEFGKPLEYLEEIADRLRGFEIPTEVRRALLHYFESKNRYAQAEDVLWDILDQTPEDRDVIEDGIAFYERLEGLHPARLQAGKLPLEEVRSGLAQVQAMRVSLP
jgi:tetratricopeptide (TPR) repeat protein